MSSMNVLVTFTGKKKIDAVIGNNIIHTDQTLKNGGEETAPAPFQLFLASIATCAGYYALEFCQSRNILTEGMSLSMVPELNTELKRYTHISISLQLPVHFPEKFHNAIIRSMNLCTVKKHLIDPPDFDINLKNP